VEDDEPLSDAEILSLEAGAADVQEGRMTSIEDNERQRRL
jgi:hypothetical protein